MITYSSILAGVAGYMEMDETDTELSDKFDILNKANDAQNAILALAPVTALDDIIKNVTGNFLKNIACYQWPSDFVRFSDLYVDYSAEITELNQGVEAVPTPENTFQVRSLDMRPQSDYPMYSIISGGFELRPVPSAAQDNGWMLRYVYKIPDMEDDGSQDSLLRADLKSPLIFKTVSLCCAVDNFNLPMSERFEKMFDNAMAALWGSNIDYKKQKEKAA